jgi:hypothetical protein
LMHLINKHGCICTILYELDISTFIDSGVADKKR